MAKKQEADRSADVALLIAVLRGEAESPDTWAGNKGPGGASLATQVRIRALESFLAAPDSESVLASMIADFVSPKDAQRARKLAEYEQWAAEQRAKENAKRAKAGLPPLT